MDAFYDKQTILDRQTSSSTNNNKNITKTIHKGVVISVEDRENGKRIKVRLTGIDDGVNDEDLPFCYPLLPFNLTIIPTERSIVRIILSDVSSPFQDRLYISEVISQFQNLSGQQFLIERKNKYNEETLFNQNKKQPIRNIPTVGDLYPKNKKELIDNISINSKNGKTDLILNQNYYSLRTNKFRIENTVKNLTNPCYINGFLEPKRNVNYNIINSDKIFLLSNKTNLNYNKNLIESKDAQEIDNLLKQVHNVGYGDTIAEFLDLFRKAFTNHVHSYDGKEPINSDFIKKLNEFDLSRIFSKDIHIN
jgi:hypothetical protein